MTLFHARIVTASEAGACRVLGGAIEHKRKNSIMQRKRQWLPILAAVVVLALIAAIVNFERTLDGNTSARFTDDARKQSLQPIHPGIPGEKPFWNPYSKRFIRPPAFEFKEVPEAMAYRFLVAAETDSQEYVFEATKPWVPLSPIWSSLPNGRLTLRVDALTAPGGQKLATVGNRIFLKSPPFAKVRNEPAFPYEQSGYRSLKNLLQQPKIQYWRTHSEPDPSYPLWTHATKIMSAVVVGMVHYAKFFPEEPDAGEALRVAEIVADFLLALTEPPGKPLEFWPATYWDGVPRGEHPYFQNEIMTNSPAIAAEMLLDLYDFTKEKDYFVAAQNIADTYVKTQNEAGTWSQILSTTTGLAIKDHKLVPTMVIELFDRLIENYALAKYITCRDKALDWCMKYPMATFNWQAQFEDTRPQKQYKNLSREEPAEFARILLKRSADHPEYVDMARELIRFAEDQFVVWEPTDPVLEYPWFKQNSKWNGTTFPGGFDWFVPCVLEQYKFYTPVARSSQLMILAYLDAYQYTNESIYHAKAVALANTLTIAQAYHGGGEIPTHLRKNLPESNWINNGVRPAITLIENAAILTAKPY